MAGLILRKIRDAFVPSEETASADPQGLHAFYSTSDDLVEEHFSAVLRDDLRSMLKIGSAAQEDWAW